MSEHISCNVCKLINETGPFYQSATIRTTFIIRTGPYCKVPGGPYFKSKIVISNQNTNDASHQANMFRHFLIVSHGGSCISAQDHEKFS